MGIIGLGNALMDVVLNVSDENIIDKLSLARAGMTMIDAVTHHQIIEFTQGWEYKYAAGGSAANTINGLARLGVKTSFIGKVGNDLTGEQFAMELDKVGTVPHLEVSQTEASGKCVSFVHQDGERTMATYLGAAIMMNPFSVRSEYLVGHKILYVEGYLLYNRDLVESAMIKAKEAGLKVAVDFASYNVVEDNQEFLDYLVDKYVDIIFANEEEAVAFTGKNAHEALEILAKRSEIVVVKIGAKGSLVAVGDQRFSTGVIDTKVVDKTGAGDLYAAGFLWGYINGYDFQVCADAGAVLSSYVIEVMGAKMTDQSWKIIDSLIEGLKNGKRPEIVYF